MLGNNVKFGPLHLILLHFLELNSLHIKALVWKCKNDRNSHKQQNYRQSETNQCSKKNQKTINFRLCYSASVHAYNSVTEDKLHLVRWIHLTLFFVLFSNTEGKNLKSVDPDGWRCLPPGAQCWLIKCACHVRGIAGAFSDGRHAAGVLEQPWLCVYLQWLIYPKFWRWSQLPHSLRLKRWSKRTADGFELVKDLLCSDMETFVPS